MTDVILVALQPAMRPPEMRHLAGAGPGAPPGMQPPGMQLHPLGMDLHGVLALLPGTHVMTRMHPQGGTALLPSGGEKHLLQQGVGLDGRQMLLKFPFW